MKGSKSIKERVFIANNAAAVYFVSEYIKNCFLEGLNQDFKNLFILPNAIQRRIDKAAKEKKTNYVYWKTCSRKRLPFIC